MPTNLNPNDLKKLESELIRYAEEGASDDELRQFRDSFTSELKKKGQTEPSSDGSTSPATPIAGGTNPSLNFGYNTLDAVIAAMPKKEEKLPTEGTTEKPDATNVVKEFKPPSFIRKAMEVKNTADFNEKYGTTHTPVEMVTGTQAWRHPKDHPKAQEEEQDANTVKEAIQSTAIGLDATYAMVLNMPKMLYSTFAIPQNLIAEHTGVNIGVHPTNDDALSQAATVYAEHAKQMLAQQQQKYDKTLFDEFNEGDKGKAIHQLSNAMIKMLPPMMAMAGAGMAGASPGVVNVGGALGFGSQKYEDIKGMNLPESTKAMNAIGSGMLMSVFNKWSLDKLTIPVAKTLLAKGEEAAVKEAKLTFEEAYKSFFKKITPVTEPLHSAIAFTGVGFATNVMDKVTGVDPNKDLSEGLGDMFIEGLALGAMTHAGTRILNRESRDKVELLHKEAEQVKVDADNPDLTPDVKEALVTTYSEKMEQMNDELHKDRNNALKYLSEERRQVDELSQQVEQNKRVLADPKISLETKKLTEATNDALNGEIDKINEAVEKRDIKEVDKLIEQQQKKLGLPDRPEILLPARAEEIMSRVETEGTANVDNIEFLAHQLYKKYQALEAIKTQPGRRFTTEQVDEVLKGLDNKITILDEAARKYREEGKQKIEIDTEKFKGEEQPATEAESVSGTEQGKEDLHNQTSTQSTNDKSGEVQETGVIQENVIKNEHDNQDNTGIQGGIGKGKESKPSESDKGSSGKETETDRMVQTSSEEDITNHSEHDIVENGIKEDAKKRNISLSDDDIGTIASLHIHSQESDNPLSIKEAVDLYQENKEEIASNGDTSENDKTKSKEAEDKTKVLGETETPAGEPNAPAVEPLVKEVKQGEIAEDQIPDHTSRETADINLSDKATAFVKNIELPDGDEGYNVSIKDAEGKEVDNQDFYEKAEVVKFLAAKQKGYELDGKKKPIAEELETAEMEIGSDVMYLDNAGGVEKGKVESVSGDEVKIKTLTGTIYTRSVSDIKRAEVLQNLEADKGKIQETLAPVKPEPVEDVKQAVQASVLPIKEATRAIFKGLNAIQDKTAKYITDAETWVADKIKQGNTNTNDALRTISQMTTAYANGLPRNNQELSNKRQLTGGIKMAQEQMGRNVTALRKLIDNDLGSMERVHEVLDPEFYEGKTGVTKMEDLTPVEKKLAETLRSMLDYVHNYNFAMGMMDAKTYEKYKGKYTPRMYETYEVPEDVKKAIEEHDTYVSKKLNTSIFKQRKEINEEMERTILKDPIYATAKRMMQTEVNASVLGYLNKIKTDPKLVSDVEQKDFQLLDGKGYGPLNGKYVPNYIAEDLKGYFFASDALNLVYNAFKAYDRTTLRQLAKKSHTVWDPGVQLGNFTSNFVFAFMGGLDPITYGGNLRKASKEIKSKGATYDLLVKNGIIGSDVISGDMLPLTEAIQTAQQQAKKPNPFMKVLGKVDDFTMKLYEGTDNNAKVAAYMGFREYGYTEAEAIQRVYDSFQNYSTVGKIWDAASKTPVFGNAYVKFQADLQRILKNAALKRPLTTAMYAGLIYTISQMASGLSDEDDKHKALREGREYIPKVDLGLAQIPLTFKTPAGEVNLARYLSPYYIYDVGDQAAPIESWSKLFPYKVKYAEGPAKGVVPWLPSFTTDDPLAGVWWATIINDRDFRGKSIQDPLSTRYRMSGITTTEKAMNSINYVLRSQLPYYDLGQDMYLTTTQGTDFYGRQKNGWQALMSKLVKTQEFGPAQYTQVIERKITGFKYKMEGLEQEAKDIDSTIKKGLEKQVKRVQDKSITKDQFDKIVVDEMGNRAKRKADVFAKMADVQKEFNEYVNKYKKFIPNK